MAASNRIILEKKPDEVDMEKLTGSESNIIEMKLGLGIFESSSFKSTHNNADNINIENSSCDSDDSSSSSSDDDDKINNKILVLPSELRAAALEAKAQNDPFERIIQSILFFGDESNSEDEINIENYNENPVENPVYNSSENSSYNRNVLDFE